LIVIVEEICTTYEKVPFVPGMKGSQKNVNKSCLYVLLRFDGIFVAKSIGDSTTRKRRVTSLTPSRMKPWRRRRLNHRQSTCCEQVARTYEVGLEASLGVAVGYSQIGAEGFQRWRGGRRVGGLGVHRPGRWLVETWTSLRGLTPRSQVPKKFMTANCLQ